MPAPYVSQLDLPATSGQPGIPSALSPGLEPLSQLAGALGTEFVRLAHEQGELDRLTAGEAVLQNVFNQATARAQELAQPGDDPASFDPRQRQADYTTFIQELTQGAMKQAQEIGGAGQRYVIQHLSNVVNPPVTKFNALMTQRWGEKNDFTLQSNLQRLSDQAVEAPSRAEVEAILDRGRDMIAAQTGVSKTGEQAATLFSKFRFDTQFKRSLGKMQANPTQAILGFTSNTGGWAEIGDPAVKKALFTELTAVFHAQEAVKENTRTRQLRELQETRERNLMTMTERLHPKMPGVVPLTYVDLTAAINPVDGSLPQLSAEGHRFLYQGKEAIDKAGGLGDPRKAARLIAAIQADPFAFTSDDLTNSVGGLNKDEVQAVWTAATGARKRRHEIDDDHEHPFHSSLYQAYEGDLKNLRTLTAFAFLKPAAAGVVDEMLTQFRASVEAHYQGQPGVPVPYERIYRGLLTDYSGRLAKKLNIQTDPRAPKAETLLQLIQQLQQIYGDPNLSAEQMNQQASNIRNVLMMLHLAPGGIGAAPQEIP